MNRSIYLFFVLILASCAGQPVPVELCAYYGGKQAAVSLTFDDGIADHTEVAAHLDSLGMRGTFWLNPSVIGTVDDYAARLTWDDCRRMLAAGHELSNHSWSHPDLTQLPAEAVRREINMADSAIEAELGVRPITFCYPFNAWNEPVDAIAREGRVGLRYFEEAQGQDVNGATPESLRSWLDKVLAAGEWGVTMTHGMYVGWDYWHDPQVLWDFYAHLASRQDSVWVAPFAEVSAYIAERDHTTLLVESRWRTVRITPMCDLDPQLFSQPLTVRVGDRLVDLDPFSGPITLRK